LRIRVRVHAGARVEKTEEREDEVHVWVKAPPVDGRANESVVTVLAALYSVRKSAVRLVSGHTSRSKVFDVEGI
jgi:uncharacterized protein (TIGR00251 family)